MQPSTFIPIMNMLTQSWVNMIKNRKSSPETVSESAGHWHFRLLKMKLNRGLSQKAHSGELQKYYSDAEVKKSLEREGEVLQSHPDGTAAHILMGKDESIVYHPNGALGYYCNKDEVAHFDELGRLTYMSLGEHQSVIYKYYGDTDKKQEETLYYGNKFEKHHFNKEGDEDTKKYNAMREIAKMRMKEERRLSEEKGKTVILPKMSKKEKAVKMMKYSVLGKDRGR